MYFWETSILGSEVKKEKDSDKTYVAYKVVVQDASQSWTIEKRYNDFYALHNKLKEKFAESQLPPVPPKPLISIFTNTDKEFIKERTVQLEKYLRGLMKKDSPTCQCGDVIDFLDPEGKSSLHTSQPIPPPEKNPIALLPPVPPRLFVLNPECIVLPEGEECFLPEYFDHISESIRYLVQVDGRLTEAHSGQSRMHIYEVEKERIKSTITTLQDHQKVANQIIKYATTTDYSNSNTNNLNYANNNNYANAYTNNYTYSPSNFYSPGYPPPTNIRTSNGYPPIQNGYAPPPLRTSNGYAPPPQNVHVYAPPQPTQTRQDEARAMLHAYVLDTCLKHIQDAIIWESGLENTLLVQCVDDAGSGFCEVQERLKWFVSECDKLIVDTLGVLLPKEERKEIKKKIKLVKEQAKKYHEELGENPKHKCTLNVPLAEHVADCRAQLQKTIDFINENRKRVVGTSAAEIVDNFESKMFALLEQIGNLETASYTTHEERKLYKEKSAEIRKKITSLMKDASDFKGQLLEEMQKLKTASPSMDRSKLPDEQTLQNLINRLEDLQENLADLSHDFGKALEIAQRDRLGSMMKEKQLDDARKVHETNEQDMFEL